jgi:hypothetical protein
MSDLAGFPKIRFSTAALRSRTGSRWRALTHMIFRAEFNRLMPFQAAVIARAAM